MQMKNGIVLPCGILCKLAEILGACQGDIGAGRSVEQLVIRVPMGIGYVQDADNDDETLETVFNLIAAALALSGRRYMLQHTL